jgi:arsenate reductase
MKTKRGETGEARESGGGLKRTAANDEVLVLVYAGCTTCKNALRWLEENDVPHRVRPIVEQPPAPAELNAWIPASGLSVRKWLNTSGMSFRALGKPRIDAASDAELVKWLAADGKLVKRPVLVDRRGGLRVLVGFKPEVWARWKPSRLA